MDTSAILGSTLAEGTITFPNGAIAKTAIRSEMTANGNPTTVIARTKAASTWAMASHHPAQTNQMMFPTDPADDDGPFTTERPNGQITYPAILNDWSPNGMVTMSTQQITPATTYENARPKPATTNQTMFPRVLTQPD